MEDQIFIRKATDVNRINDLLTSMYEKQYELIDICTWFEDPTNYGDCKEESILLSFVKKMNCHLYFYKFFSVKNKSIQVVISEMNEFVKQKSEEGYELFKTLTLSDIQGYIDQPVKVNKPSFILIFRQTGEVLIPMGEVEVEL